MPYRMASFIHLGASRRARQLSYIATVTCALCTLLGCENSTTPAADSPAAAAHNWGRWTPRQSPDRPSRRFRHAVGFDPIRQRVILVGGIGTNGESLTDTWAYDNGRWRELRTTARPGSPSKCWELALDEKRNRLVLLDGANTWEWTGADWLRIAGKPTTWTQNRLLFALAYDRHTQSIVAFGGSHKRPSQETDAYWNDIWRLDGSHWTRLHAQGSPSARMGHRMCPSPWNNDLLLFGGFTEQGIAGYLTGDILDDAWSWDGLTWHRESSLSLPDSLFAFAVALDDERSTIVLFGGAGRTRLGGGGASGATIERDDQAWHILVGEANPTPRFASAMTYDPVRRVMILFGGKGARGLLSDTWEYSVDSQDPDADSAQQPSSEVP